MTISPATSSDLADAVGCLTAAFAHDPITGFLLQPGSGYNERVTQFFALLMRARLARAMPVVVARDGGAICGAAMGDTTVRSAWPPALAAEWERFEAAVPGMDDRMAVYEVIATRCKPPAPHYYLGVIGIDPRLHGRGFGTQVLEAFCALSANDSLSSGVYLETAEEANVRFYERAGFEETGRGTLGGATLWCMYLLQGGNS